MNRLLFCLLFLGFLSCKETQRDEAPPTANVTAIRIQPAAGPPTTVSPTSSPIAISRSENQLSVSIILRDNEALKGYSISISPAPNGALGAGTAWSALVAQDTLSGSERILTFVPVAGTNPGLASGPYDLKITCTDRAGNTSSQFRQSLQLN